MDAAVLAAEVLKRKLGQDEVIEPGTYPCRGTALVDVDTIVTKLGDTEAPPAVPWKAIAAALVGVCDDAGVAKSAIMAGIRKGMRDESAMPSEIGQAIEELRAKLPRQPRAGATQIAGTVKLVGFVPSEVELPGWPEMKARLIRGRRAA